MFRGAVGDKFLFMDDNTTCYRTVVAKEYLDSEDIQRLVWPSGFPELNPSENVWNVLAKCLADR